MSYRIPYEHCPLCESSDFKVQLRADCSKHPLFKPPLPTEMRWMECGSCAHQFVDGYFNQAALELIFSGTHENQSVGYQIEAQRKVSSKIIDKVLPYAEIGRWLDIGFGNASLLFTAQEYGFVPIGVDLRRHNVELLNQLGIEAHCADIMDLDFDRPFSVISMMDVLEHVPFPRDMLRAVSRNLDPKGIVIISMPNSENILWKLMTEQDCNPYLSELEHYHNFSRSRLYDLMSECGIEPVRYGISERYRACMEVIGRRMDE